MALNALQRTVDKLIAHGQTRGWTPIKTSHVHIITSAFDLFEIFYERGA